MDTIKALFKSCVYLTAIFSIVTSLVGNFKGTAVTVLSTNVGSFTQNLIDDPTYASEITSKFVDNELLTDTLANIDGSTRTSEIASVFLDTFSSNFKSIEDSLFASTYN